MKFCGIAIATITRLLLDASLDAQRVGIPYGEVPLAPTYLCFRIDSLVEFVLCYLRYSSPSSQSTTCSLRLRSRILWQTSIMSSFKRSIEPFRSKFRHAFLAIRKVSLQRNSRTEIFDILRIIDVSFQGRNFELSAIALIIISSER